MKKIYITLTLILLISLDGISQSTYRATHVAKKIDGNWREFVPDHSLIIIDSEQLVIEVKMECFWSHLKRGIDGIYHWVSDEHLQSYIDEFTLRFNTRHDTINERFDLILCNVIGRLTYKELINKE